MPPRMKCAPCWEAVPNISEVMTTLLSSPNMETTDWMVTRFLDFRVESTTHDADVDATIMSSEMYRNITNSKCLCLKTCLTNVNLCPEWLK